MCTALCLGFMCCCCMQVAARRTLAAGKGSGVQHLLNFTAEGNKPVADPEDDKLWLSVESKHTLLEFDFARTWAQVWRGGEPGDGDGGRLLHALLGTESKRQPEVEH